MLVLLDTISGEIKSYPRSDEEPVQQLDPRYTVLRRVIAEQPDYDASTERLVEARSVDLDAAEWIWGWTVEALPVPAPTPDWGTFKRGVMSHPAVNMALGGGLGQVPAAAIALPATVIASAAGGDVDDFRSAWLALRRVGLISAELLAEVRLLAIACHLPEPFVAALGGAARPAAEFVGQEWVDSAGDLWVVVQARGEDGQFLADDPETLERESLAWERVEG